MAFIGAKGTDDVTLNARTHTITHNLGGTNIIVSAVPNWATQVYKTSSTVNAVVVTLSVPAPSGAKLDWGAELGVLTNSIKKTGPRKRGFTVHARQSLAV